MSQQELEEARAKYLARRRRAVIDGRARAVLREVGPDRTMEQAAEMWKEEDRAEIIARAMEMQAAPQDGVRIYSAEEIKQYMAAPRQQSEEEIEADMIRKRIPRGMGPIIRDRVRELMREAAAKGESLHTSDAQRAIEAEFGYRFDYHSFSVQYFFRARKEEEAIKAASDASNARAAKKRDQDPDGVGVIELRARRGRPPKAKPSPAREVLQDSETPKVESKTSAETIHGPRASITISITSEDPEFIDAFLSSFRSSMKRSA